MLEKDITEKYFKQAAAFREASASRGVPIAYVEAKPRGFASTQ